MRRTQIAADTFPPKWLTILEQNFALYSKLPTEIQSKLLKLIQVFVAEKEMEGMEGLEITDEIRVTIAAPACLLLLNEMSDYYPKISRILVYPTAFIDKKNSRLSALSSAESQTVRVGEAWKNDYVILAWDSSRAGVLDSKDGLNTILHEFAHVLDVEDGWFDGTPLLPSAVNYADWAKIIRYEFDELSETIHRLDNPVLREYATTNIAEFFAVATEVFFEKPKQLKKKYPELYAQLSGCYGLDPSLWQS